MLCRGVNCCIINVLAVLDLHLVQANLELCGPLVVRRVHGYEAMETTCGLAGLWLSKERCCDTHFEELEVLVAACDQWHSR